MSNIFKIAQPVRVGNFAADPSDVSAGAIYWKTGVGLFVADGSSYAQLALSTSEFLTGAFRLKDSTAPTKQISFDATAIVAGNTRSLKMPNANVDLAALDNTNIASAAAIALNKLAAVTANRVLLSDASGFVSASTVTNTTLGYLDATSSIQTQINGKESTITTLPISKGGTNSGTALNNGRIMSTVAGAIVEAAAITPAYALISDANGIPTHSSVSSATLAYLDVSSSVNTLISGRVADTGDTMTGTLAMGANKVTSSYVPLAGDDLVNKTALDNAITGLSWKAGVQAFNLRGNLTIAGIDGLSPVQGDQYLATDAGTPAAGTSDALAVGDIAEFNGTSWKKIIANSGGFVPLGTRAVLGGSGASIGSPYTNASDNDKIVSFSGASNTGTSTGDTVNNASIFVQDPGHISYYDNSGFVYEGSVPSGSWIQFSGAGQINAGVGLDKSGNTLSVKLGAGIKELPSSEVGIEIYSTAPGLILTTDGTTPSTATNAKLRAYDIADANIASAAAIAVNKLAAVTANRVLLSDASGFVSASTVTNTTLGYLDATSSIQTQLNGKEPSFATLPISKGGTNSGTALNNNRIMASVGGAVVEAAAITAARALISDANGIPVHSSVTSATLAFLDATSSVQTQLNGKLANVVEDTSPQLGGDLDPNGKSITGIVRRGAAPTTSIQEEYLDSLAISPSTTAVQSGMTFDTKVFKRVDYDYTITNGNDRRAGTLSVVCNNASGAAASVLSLTDISRETADVLVSWAVAMNGDNCEFSYTSGAGTLSMRSDCKRWRA